MLAACRFKDCPSVAGHGGTWEAEVAGLCEPTQRDLVLKKQTKLLQYLDQLDSLVGKVMGHEA